MKNLHGTQRIFNLSDLSKSEMAVLGFVRGYFSGTGEFPHISDVAVGLGINTRSVSRYMDLLIQKDRLQLSSYDNDRLVIANHNLPHRTHKDLPSFMHKFGFMAIKYPE